MPRLILTATAAICFLLLAVVPSAAAQEDPTLPVADEVSEDSSAEAVEVEVALPDEGSVLPAVRIQHLGQQIAIFQDLEVTENQVVDGQIVCVGGDLVIRGDVYGQIVLVGGTLKLHADVHAEVIAVASEVEIEDGTEILGDLIVVASKIEDYGVSVSGDRIEVPLPLPTISGGGAFSILTSLIAWLKAGRMLFLLLLVILVVAIMPNRIQVMSEQFAPRFGMSLLVGFSIQLAKYLLIIVLGISVIGAPLIPIVVIFEWVIRLVGRTAVLHFFGQRLGATMNRQLSVLGAALLGFLIFAIVSVLPFMFGWLGLMLGIFIDLMLLFVVDWPGVGLALVSKFGDPEQAR